MKITLNGKVHAYISRGEYKARISPIQRVIVLHGDLILECVGGSWPFKSEMFLI